MKFLVMTLISNGPDPVTGRTPTPNARFRRVVDNAVLAEELGFDGYAVGERHERPFFSSAPPVVLSHIAARTSWIRLFTAVTTLSLLDPVGYALFRRLWREERTTWEGRFRPPLQSAEVWPPPRQQPIRVGDRRQQVSPATAIAFVEQVWGRDLSLRSRRRAARA